MLTYVPYCSYCYPVFTCRNSRSVCTLFFIQCVFIVVRPEMSHPAQQSPRGLYSRGTLLQGLKKKPHQCGRVKPNFFRAAVHLSFCPPVLHTEAPSLCLIPIFVPTTTLGLFSGHTYKKPASNVTKNKKKKKELCGLCPNFCDTIRKV